MMPKTMQTMAWAYQQICAGEAPWTALGNFTNAWYDYAKDIRVALVSELLGKPEADTEHIRHWGAFCAASWRCSQRSKTSEGELYLLSFLAFLRYLQNQFDLHSGVGRELRDPDS